MDAVSCMHNSRRFFLNHSPHLLYIGETEMLKLLAKS